MRWKIEDRVLERIGRVVRMENGRMTKALVLGLYKRLESTGNVKERIRKSVL